MIKALLNRPWPDIQQSFLDAYDYRPIRAEPLYQISRIYRQVHNKPRLAYIFAKMAMEIPFPKEDILFIGNEIYKWQILDEIGASAYYAGKPHVGYHACKRLLDENLIPEDNRQRVEDNFKQYEKIVTAIQAQMAQEEVERIEKEKEEKKKNKQDNINRNKKGSKSNQNKRGKKKKRKRK